MGPTTRTAPSTGRRPPAWVGTGPGSNGPGPRAQRSPYPTAPSPSGYLFDRQHLGRHDRAALALADEGVLVLAAVVERRGDDEDAAGRDSRAFLDGDGD